MARRDAWSANAWPTTSDVVIHLLEPRLIHAAWPGGVLSEAEQRSARGAWISAMRRSALFEPETLWAVDTAAPVSTPDEAAEALRTLPASLRPDAVGYSAPSFLTEAFTGHALLLGGRLDEALPLLRSAAASCEALNDPFVHTRVHLWLGRALEQRGDAPGACAAYEIVLRRWGRAKLRSTTVDGARKRVDALRCPR